MAIIIRFGPDGPQAVCDTTAEALELLKQGSSYANSLPGKDNPKQEEHARDHAPYLNGNSAPPNDQARAVLAEINSRCKALLQGLAQYPNGVEATELSHTSGIEQNSFGGLNGAVSKIAENHSLSFEKFVKSEARFKGRGKEKQRYRWMAPTKLLLDNMDLLKG